MLSLMRRSPEPTRDAALEREPSRRSLAPPVDIHETAEAIVMHADLPGVAQDGVEVRLEHDQLTIRGRNRSSQPTGTPAWQEYEPVDYERTFTLGDSIDQGGIKATIKDGVLRLDLPKVRAVQPRQIAVSGV